VYKLFIINDIKKTLFATNKFPINLSPLGDITIFYRGAFYKFIELPPNAPNTAEATAIITFKIVSHTFPFITLVSF